MKRTLKRIPMKSLLAIACGMWLLAGRAAGSVTHEWTRQLGTSHYDRSFGVSADGLGNVYLSGCTGGSLGGPHAGGSDAFVVKFSEAILAGDYNNNGTVDAADYVVWRNGLGTLYTQSDYGTWRANFGQSAGSGAAVPEPVGLVMLLTTATVWMWGRRPRTV